VVAQFTIFSPAGDEMFFVKYYATQYMEMNYMKVEKWRMDRTGNSLVCNTGLC